MMKWGMEVNLSPAAAASSYPSASSTINCCWFIEEEDSKARRWSPAENKMFENGLALHDKDTPDRWLKIANMIPGKKVEDVMRHYRELEVDVSNIEAGLIPIPGYNTIISSSTNSPPFFFFTMEEEEWPSVNSHHGFHYGFKQQPSSYGGFSCGKRSSSAARLPEQDRKKGIPWTEEEHKLFLMGLNKYGKGDWRNISRNFVITRTPTQVASHAQKYFIRQLSVSGGGGKDKRRASIHDITTVENLLTDNCSSKGGPPPQSSDQSAATIVHSQSPSSSAPMSRSAQPANNFLWWNQPNDNNGGGQPMVFNATRGNGFATPPPPATAYGVNSYGVLKQMQEGQNLQRSGSNINNVSSSFSYIGNPNHFQLESVQQHYPLPPERITVDILNRLTSVPLFTTI